MTFLARCISLRGRFLCLMPHFHQVSGQSLGSFHLSKSCDRGLDLSDSGSWMTKSLLKKKHKTLNAADVSQLKFFHRSIKGTCTSILRGHVVFLYILVSSPVQARFVLKSFSQNCIFHRHMGGGDGGLHRLTIAPPSTKQSLPSPAHSLQL